MDHPLRRAEDEPLRLVAELQQSFAEARRTDALRDAAVMALLTSVDRRLGEVVAHLAILNGRVGRGENRGDALEVRLDRLEGKDRERDGVVKERAKLVALVKSCGAAAKAAWPWAVVAGGGVAAYFGLGGTVP